jgi:hypothetical protein
MGYTVLSPSFIPHVLRGCAVYLSRVRETSFMYGQTGLCSSSL